MERTELKPQTEKKRSPFRNKFLRLGISALALTSLLTSCSRPAIASENTLPNTSNQTQRIDPDFNLLGVDPNSVTVTFYEDENGNVLPHCRTSPQIVDEPSNVLNINMNIGGVYAREISYPEIASGPTDDNANSADRAITGGFWLASKKLIRGALCFILINPTDRSTSHYMRWSNGLEFDPSDIISFDKTLGRIIFNDGNTLPYKYIDRVRTLTPLPTH